MDEDTEGQPHAELDAAQFAAAAGAGAPRGATPAQWTPPVQPAPLDPAGEASTGDRMLAAVRRWADQHIRNSPIAEHTAGANHFTLVAMPALERLIKEIV